MLGLNRKQMEEERLARLAGKRKRSESPAAPPAKQSDGIMEETTQKRARTAVSPPPTRANEAASSIATHRPASTETSKLQYPNGAVKRTWSPYHERSNDIKFSEVLNKDELRTAVFSSFQWDLDWLFNHLDMKRTNMILVMGAKTAAEREMFARDLASQGLSNVKLCLPKLPEKGHGVMHSKLMLLFYKDHCRIVVPTANLVPYDWGETGIMENTVFLIDLPRKVAGSTDAPGSSTAFEDALISFLRNMDIQTQVLDGLKNFDFAAARNMGFVYSAYLGESPAGDSNVGIQGLDDCVRKLGLQTKPGSRMDYVTSSLGLLDEKLLGSIATAASGSKSSQRTSPTFRVYFPTSKTIKESLGGTPNGGTICLGRKYYNIPGFSRSSLRDYKATRSGLLSHSKILYVRGQPDNEKERQSGTVADSSPASWISWCYIGSANLTTSAWGSYTKKGFGCRNWECGVVLKGRRSSSTADDTNDPSGKKSSEASPLSLASMFSDVMEIPMAEENVEYGAGDVPWFFEEHM